MTFFENALAVHGDLLCLQSTLVGVHALTLMVCYHIDGILIQKSS